MRQPANGRYAHPFFYLELDDTVELDDSGNIELNGTLAHEYCHYLQDLTTNVGLMGIIAYSSALQDLIQYAKTRRDMLHIPAYTYNQDNLNYFRYISRLWGCTYFDVDYDIICYRLIRSRCSPFLDMFKIRSRNDKIACLGTFAMFESMAKSLESSLFSNTITSHEYPYLICNKLIKHIHNDFQDSHENVLALCDATLMHTNPGVLFIKSLEVMQKKGIILKNMHEIYDFIEEEPELRPYRRLFNEGYHTHYLIAYRNIKNICELMGLEGGWILQRLEKASYLRNTCPRFWISVLQGASHNDRLLAYHNIMQEVGFPAVYDRDGQLFFQGVDNENELFGHNIFCVIHFLYDLLAQGKTMCYLLSYCSSNEDSRKFVSRNCLSKPWKQVDDGNMCLFAIVWKRLSLPTNVCIAHR